MKVDSLPTQLKKPHKREAQEFIIFCIVGSNKESEAAFAIR